MDEPIANFKARSATVYAPAHLLAPYRDIVRGKAPRRSLRDELIFRLTLIVLSHGGQKGACEMLCCNRATLNRWLTGKCFPGTSLTIDRIDVTFSTALKMLQLGELRGRRDLRRAILKRLGAVEIETDFGTVTTFPNKYFTEQPTEQNERTNDNSCPEPGGSGRTDPDSGTGEQAPAL